MSQDFIFENFCRPIIDSSVQGYNFVNTSVYAIILFAVIVYFLYPFLNKRGIQFNFKFMLALIPFVIFGATFRVLTDQGFFQKTCNPLEFGFWTFTPGIWFLTAAIVLIGIIVAQKYSKEEDFYRNFGIIGSVFALPVVLFLFSIFKVWDGFGLVILIAAALTIATKYVVELKYKGFFDNKLNLLVVGGQVLDGAATFVATDIFACGEQHPLSAGILNVHPALFILVKIVLALLIIYYVEQDVKDKNFSGFIKVAVIILGLATGTRDLFTLGAGTCL